MRTKCPSEDDSSCNARPVHRCARGRGNSPPYRDSDRRTLKASKATHHVISAGLLAVVHNTYAAASIAETETTTTTTMSTTAHM